MSDQKYNATQDPYADARTFKSGIGPSDFDKIRELHEDGKTPDELENLLGIEEEVIAEHIKAKLPADTRADPNAQLKKEQPGIDHRPAPRKRAPRKRAAAK